MNRSFPGLIYSIFFYLYNCFSIKYEYFSYHSEETADFEGQIGVFHQATGSSPEPAELLYLKSLRKSAVSRPAGSSL